MVVDYAPEFKFGVGSEVAAVTSSYQSPGTVVAAFKTLTGQVRYVMEHWHPKGMLFIYNETQLRDHLYHSHRSDCPVRKHPEEDYELGNPDSEQHCVHCHCTCPNKPQCNHWIGCPGC